MRSLVAAVVTLALLLGLPSGVRLTGAWGRWGFPPPPRYEDFVHLRQIEVSQTIAWRRHTRRVSYAQLLAGEDLWADMHFGDWDRLPAAWRWPPLARLLRTGLAVADAPDVWGRMTASDWDRVAQPVRAIAFLDMVEAWRACLEPGAERDLPPAVVGTRLRAIAMAESWFDHRAVHVNGDDSLDLGLGQASAFARETLRQLHAAGAVDFTLADEEYFEPFGATRALVFCSA